MIALPPQSPLHLVDIRPDQHHLGIPFPSTQRYLNPPQTRTSHEYAGLFAQDRPTLQKAKRVAGRSTMSSATTSQRPQVQTSQYSSRPQQTTDSFFAFLAPPVPTKLLTFSPRISPPRAEKRGRAITDIDGEQSSLFRKKRRLRLFLITSRLSPEFSHPASNIVDRGSSKIAVWAKQKALGRNLLRKAAILNGIRRRAVTTREEMLLGRSPEEQEKERNQLELAKLAFVYGSHDTHTRPFFQRTSSIPPAIAIKIASSHPKQTTQSTPSESPPPSTSPQSASTTTHGPVKALAYQSPNTAYASPAYEEPPLDQLPRRTQFPLPPSPLGLSNYDAFDLDDEIPDPYAHLDDDNESDDDVYDSEARSRVRSSSASTTASYAPTLSTAHSGNSDRETVRTPPPTIYSDFNVFDHAEPVLGDYDGLEAFEVWPNVLAPVPQLQTAHVFGERDVTRTESKGAVSCSPNFRSILASSGHGGLENGRRGEVVRGDADEHPRREEEREREKKVMFLQLNS